RLARRLVVAEPESPLGNGVIVAVQLRGKLLRCEWELHHVDLFRVGGRIDRLIQEAFRQLTPVKVQERVGLNLLYAQAQIAGEGVVVGHSRRHREGPNCRRSSCPRSTYCSTPACISSVRSTGAIAITTPVPASNRRRERKKSDTKKLERC